MIRRKRLRQRMLDSIDFVEPKGKPGEITRGPFHFRSKKDRRGSGRKYPKCKVPQRVLDDEGIVILEYWDDWWDYRDGFRDHPSWTGEDDC